MNSSPSNPVARHTVVLTSRSLGFEFFACSPKTTIYTPLGTMSLEDSLCYFNDGLAGKPGIGRIRICQGTAMAHWPMCSHAFQGKWTLDGS